MNNNEDLLKQYEKKKENNIFRLLTENSIDILFLLDTEANFIYLSKALKRNRISQKEMIGKILRTFLQQSHMLKQYSPQQVEK